LIYRRDPKQYYWTHADPPAATTQIADSSWISPISIVSCYICGWYGAMNGNTTTLFGVTLRISSSHPSSLAVLNHQSHLIQLSLFHTDLELLQLAGIYRPTLIAIGLPYACQQAFPTWNPPGTPLLLP
jgi:hypothetical protein